MSFCPFKDLKPDTFYHVCPTAGNAKVESESAMQTLAENQKTCADDLSSSLEGLFSCYSSLVSMTTILGSEQDQMINDAKPTLVGVHAHLTTHIQDHQDFYR